MLNRLTCLLLVSPLAHALPNGLGLTPPMGFSSWNAFASNVTADAITGVADILISSGLASLGYTYVNIDCGWNLGSRNSSGYLQADPSKFPSGLRPVSDYIHGKGLKIGLYTEHYTQDCCGGPGAFGHNAQDAALMTGEFQIDYLKVDSCAGHDLNATQQWDNYAAIRDALNATGRPVYLSICPTIPATPNPPCQAWDNVYAPWPGVWNAPDHDVRDLSNSFLVEFCNNANVWDTVLTIVDAQAALTSANLSGPGHWSDNDMLTVGCSDTPNPGTPCAGDLTYTQQVAQFSLWCIFASPLILGNDLRYMSAATLSIIGNAEAIAVDQDPLGVRGTVVYESFSVNPNARVVPCDASDPGQAWTFHADGSLSAAVAPSMCLDVWNCGVTNGTVVDVYACHVSTPACGSNVSTNQVWTYNSGSGTITSALGDASTGPLCLDLYNGVGPNVDLWACHDSPNQQWNITGAPGNGSVQLVSAASGACLSSQPPSQSQIFAKPLADGSRAVVMLNRGTLPTNMTVTWAMVQFDAPAPWAAARVRDVWLHADVASDAIGGFTAQVNATGVVMLRVTQVA